MSGDREAFALHEFEVAVEAMAAGTRHRVAVAWLRSADADLTGLDRPAWGGVVDRWHDAADAVADSADVVTAYEAFGGYTGR